MAFLLKTSLFYFPFLSIYSIILDIRKRFQKGRKNETVIKNDRGKKSSHHVYRRLG